MIKTSARCFMGRFPGRQRYGVWIMTGPWRGAFYHGDREEIQSPDWTLPQLHQCSRTPFDICLEITPELALKILENWPKGYAHALTVLGRHPKGEYNEYQFSDLPSVVFE